MFHASTKQYLIRFGVIAFAAFLLASSAISSRAATATVVSFNAVFKTTPTSHDQIDYHYTATWSTSGLVCFHKIDWYFNNLFSSNLASGLDNTSPVDVTGTTGTSPHTMGTGNYYHFHVEVNNNAFPPTIWASDSKDDGDLTQ